MLLSPTFFRVTVVMIMLSFIPKVVMADTFRLPPIPIHNDPRKSGEDTDWYSVGGMGGYADVVNPLFTNLNWSHHRKHNEE